MKKVFFVFFILLFTKSFSQIIDTVYISNVDDLQTAIKSNRIIVLTKKNILLKKTLLIKNINNLTLTSNLSQNHASISEISHNDVIDIQNSNHITFRNLIIKQLKFCSNSIINSKKSNDITIDNCQLLGKETTCENLDSVAIIHSEYSNISCFSTIFKGDVKYINYATRSNIFFKNCSFYTDIEKDIGLAEVGYKNCDFYDENKTIISKNYNGYYPKEIKKIASTMLANYPPWKDNYGYDEGVLGGSCYNTCEVSASSTLTATKKNNYVAKNTINFDGVFYKNAWIEGVKGAGIGERITYKVINILGDGEPWRMGLNFKLVNGYAKNLKTWQNNNRVKSFKLYRNGIYLATIKLQDTPNAQEINLGDIGYKNWPTLGEVFEFEIATIYKGKKYNDTAISLLVFSCSP